MRRIEGKYGIKELEHEGAIWFFPTSYLPQFRAQFTARPQLFSINVQRLPASTAPPADRTKLPKGTGWIYMNTRAQQMEYGALDHEEDQLQHLYKTFEGQFSIEVLRHYLRCLNPTAAEAEPVVAPIESDDPVKIAERKETSEAVSDAWALWGCMGGTYVSKDWLKQIHQDAIDAGLRKPTDVLQPDSNVARFRVSREDDWDIRGLDYALRSEDGNPPAALADWKPLPQHAAAPEWVRLGVNLFRCDVGRRLIKEEEWPPRPTTLMMLKEGRQS